MSEPPVAWYESFAVNEARGESAIYEAWALGVAADHDVLSLLRTLPLRRQQPNLIFACSRLLGAPEGDYATWRDWLIANWSAVAIEAQRRTTQTNEPGRCATLLPLLARIPGPLALIEAGASAGLCLQPDRYSYLYDGAHRIDPPGGPSEVLLESATTGPLPLPNGVPDVVWRAGLDLNPLSVDDPAAMDWLDTLIWPEQTDRLARIRAAAAIERAHPFPVERGDLLVDLPALVAQAPSDATVVVFHTAVLPYVLRADRDDFFEQVRALDVHWIACEPWAALHWLPPEDAHPATRFALVENGELRGFADPHGRALDWL